MEQGPESYYGDRDNEIEAALRSKKTFEQLLAETPEMGQETKVGGRTFEELVHEALEEELRYERDPALRDQASQRADQILAEFQEVRQNHAASKGRPEIAKPEESRQSNSPQKIARQIGLSADKLRQAARSRPRTNYGLADMILAIVIAILLIIVILLLIF